MNISFKAIMIIFAGSGLGGVARYVMQVIVHKIYPTVFPLGTFTVNILGCFLIGIFYALSEKNNLLTPEWRIALTTGFCGGFTTFSSFAYENTALIKDGSYINLALYIGGSAFLGIAAVFAGVFIVKWL